MGYNLFSDSELVDELSTRYSKTLNSSSTLDFFIHNLAKFDIEDLEKLVENAPKWRV
jgi:lantibiotic modifying enzyme